MIKKIRNPVTKTIYALKEKDGKGTLIGIYGKDYGERNNKKLKKYLRKRCWEALNGLL